MDEVYVLPPDFQSAQANAVLRLADAVDDVVSLAPRLSRDELEAVMLEHQRLWTLLMDARDARRVA